MLTLQNPQALLPCLEHLPLPCDAPALRLSLALHHSHHVIPEFSLGRVHDDDWEYEDDDEFERDRKEDIERAGRMFQQDEIEDESART